jgi:molecular chaperone DnaK (HSP70)
MSETNGELIIAIDFGATYTGVAFAISRYCFKPKDVFNDLIVVVESWPNSSSFYPEKTPTTMACHNGRLNIVWGQRMVMPSDSTQVHHFKLGMEERTKNYYFSSSDPENFPTLAGILAGGTWKLEEQEFIDFVAEYLKEVILYSTKKYLLRKYGQEFLANQRMKFVLTVPAIWSDKAKSLTKRAARIAGIPENDLDLVIEPEAAALYCSISCHDITLKDGDVFLICDAGGLTVVLKHGHCHD